MENLPTLAPHGGRSNSGNLRELLKAFATMRNIPHPMPISELLRCTLYERTAAFLEHGRFYSARYCPIDFNDAVFPTRWGKSDIMRTVGYALSNENALRGWAALLEFIANRARGLPGLYVFLDVDERPLYVGKACSVKNRLLQHLRGHGSMRARDQILQLTHYVRAFYADDGEYILASEDDLISEYDPPGNRRLSIEKWRDFASPRLIAQTSKSSRTKQSPPSPFRANVLVPSRKRPLQHLLIYQMSRNS